MEHPSELERFLLSQSKQGESQDEGHFTIAREMSLKKLAEFQLPFEGAWLVKVVQAAVAEQSRQPIRVELTSRQAQIYFQVTDLTLDEIEEAFFQPEYQGKRSLRHLLSALWAVGIHHRWSFQIMLSDDSSTLVWDGERLHRKVSEQKLDCAFLAVCHSPPEGGSRNWIKNRAEASHRNLQFAETLERNCYACPVPLSVDQRRIDSLLNCPTHGWGSQTLPLWIGKAKLEAPNFGVPPGTFLGVAANKPSQEFFGSVWSYWETSLAQEAIPKVASFQNGAVVYLFSTKVELLKLGSGRAQTQEWRASPEQAQLHWIADGAVVQTERLRSRRATDSSAAIFVSAENLRTDLSGLTLSESEEKRARRKDSLSAVAEELRPSNFSVLLALCEKHQKKNVRKHVLSPLGIAAVGVPVGFALPPIGGALILVGVGTSLLRAFILRAGDQVYRTRIRDHRRSLLTLLEEDLEHVIK